MSARQNDDLRAAVLGTARLRIVGGERAIRAIAGRLDALAADPLARQIRARGLGASLGQWLVRLAHRGVVRVSFKPDPRVGMGGHHLRHTVIDLMKSYSSALRPELDAKSPVFNKLAALYNAGIGPTRMDGFYRGALVSWEVSGLLALTLR